MNIREQIEKIMNSYDPECDRHPDGVQVNVTDMRMLEMIENLAYRLARLEIFTGMVAPEPLPETKPAGDAPTEARATTFAGSVDYGDNPEVEQLDADGALRF